MYVQDCRHFGSWTLNSVQWTLPFSWNTFSLLLSFPCPRAISNIKFPLKFFFMNLSQEIPPTNLHQYPLISALLVFTFFIIISLSQDSLQISLRWFVWRPFEWEKIDNPAPLEKKDTVAEVGVQIWRTLFRSTLAGSQTLPVFRTISTALSCTDGADRQQRLEAATTIHQFNILTHFKLWPLDH